MTAIDTKTKPQEQASAPPTDDMTAKAARDWRRERDRSQPLKRDLEAERRAAIREFIGEALTPALNDLDACFLSIDNADDIGAAYHFRRLIAAVKNAAHGFRDLSS
jgi:hypothetical protein